MKKSIFTTFMLALLGLAAMSSFADDMKMDMPAAKADVAKPITGTGIVVSTNPAAGSVTLKHQAIPAIGWSAMTMPFKVKQTVRLDKLKKGDEVQFTLEKQDKEYVISSIK